ncbi:MAG TPA: aldo/keto reductase [Bryobacteraceae bacterium]
MSNSSRRDFLKQTLAAGIIAGAAPLTIPAAKVTKRSATDWVPLGNSGVKVTRQAFGTGTHGGKVQRELGQEQFTKLVRHAYDRGIRFFETAESYRGMPEMLSIALKGIPRDSYRLMTKMRSSEATDLPTAVDRLRKQLNTEYVDIVLLHCVRTRDWAEEFKPIRDTFSEAKERKKILAHGASCHGTLPLNAFPGEKWLDVALMRVNNAGVKMDTLRGDDAEPGDVPKITSVISKVHGQGTGVIGMKIMGEGRFTAPEQRDASLKFVMNLGTVDAVTIGYKSIAEIDEAMNRINTHLNA